MTKTLELNGPTRKTLASQLDRLDSILDGLSEGLTDAVASAVREAVGLAVQEAVQAVLTELLTNPALREQLQRPAASEAAPPDGPANKHGGGWPTTACVLRCWWPWPTWPAPPCPPRRAAATMAPGLSPVGPGARCGGRCPHRASAAPKCGLEGDSNTGGARLGPDAALRLAGQPPGRMSPRRISPSRSTAAAAPSGRLGPSLTAASAVSAKHPRAACGALPSGLQRRRRCGLRAAPATTSFL